MARSLDDLDRLAFRLSRTVRTQYPHLLSQGFTLTDLEERLLPFREVRREMADGGADAFETSLLRLIAGERGYIQTDPALQSACRQALAFPSPTLAMIRSWGTSIVRLNQSGNTPAASSQVASSPAAAPPVATAAPDPRAEQSPNRHTDANDLFPAPSGSGQTVAQPFSEQPASPAAATAPCCRYCASSLPVGRKVTFCPHCGMDLTKRQCPACSTELEAHWRFCVTCGRSG